MYRLKVLVAKDTIVPYTEHIRTSSIGQRFLKTQIGRRLDDTQPLSSLATEFFEARNGEGNPENTLITRFTQPGLEANS